MTDERSQFEQWWNGLNYPRNNKSLDIAMSELAWSAWQAARSAPAQPTLKHLLDKLGGAPDYSGPGVKPAQPASGIRIPDIGEAPEAGAIAMAAPAQPEGETT